ncbi:MAG: putative metallopeptidase [Candidatus Aenigmatarchaeota archaeon]
MRFEQAPDVKEKLERIVLALGMEHIDTERVVCMRSFGSTSDAHARIWSMPRIWKKALGIKAHYVIEVLSEKYDGFDESEKEKTLIHELLHVPKTFSGALVNHRARVFDGKGGHRTIRIGKREVEKLHREYRKFISSP